VREGLTTRFDNVLFYSPYIGENYYGDLPFYSRYGDYKPEMTFRVGDGEKYTMEITVEIDGKRQMTVVEGMAR